MTNTSVALNVLKQQAGDAVRHGEMDLAEQIWVQVLDRDPHDQDGLFAMGFHAQMKGEITLAIARFRSAVEFSEPDPLFRLTLAKALKNNGDIEGHFVALTAALDADAYFVPAHLMRAEGLIDAGQIGAATQAYTDVLKIVGPRLNWPDPLKPDLEQAKAWVDRQAKVAEQAYGAALASVRDGDEHADWERLNEAAAILAGTSKVFHQEPIMLHIPRLPAIPFYKNSDFAWLSALESQSHLIVDELTAGFAQAQDLSVPYVAYDRGAPVNQWGDLNHSKRWSAVFFYKNGQEYPLTHTHFPQTAAILKALPLANIGGFCPNVMLSTLAPRSSIPPHTGETNARLVVHLPLIVPENCRYRVGNEWRVWEVGKALIFDDSIEHEAINDSDEPRVVLIFDIWNPYLTAGECDAVRALLATRSALLSG
jgi:aspartate beta-hydroxylase